MPRSLASEMSGRARRAALDLRVELPTSWPVPRRSASSSDFASAAKEARNQNAEGDRAAPDVHFSSVEPVR